MMMMMLHLERYAAFSIHIQNYVINLERDESLKFEFAAIGCLIMNTLYKIYLFEQYLKSWSKYLTVNRRQLKCNVV